LLDFEWVLIGAAVDQERSFVLGPSVQGDELYGDSSEDHSALSGLNYLCIHSVGAIASTYYHELLSSALQILVNIFVIQIEQGQVDGFKQTLSL
jgi:hypothetical protein